MNIFGCTITRDTIVDVLSIIALALVLPMMGILTFGVVLILVPLVIAGVVVDCIIRKDN
jgi:hypothetical protein